MRTKIILITALIILVFALFSAFSMPLYPFQGMHTTQRITEFRFTGMATKIYVDDNPDFTSPVIVKNPFIIDLEPGTYYWKTSGLSIIRNFTIDSDVTINVVKKENQTYAVQNRGNTIIDLFFRNLKDLSFTGQTILNRDEEIEINPEKDIIAEASQYEKGEKEKV